MEMSPTHSNEFHRIFEVMSTLDLNIVRHPSENSAGTGFYTRYWKYIAMIWAYYDFLRSENIPTIRTMKQTCHHSFVYHVQSLIHLQYCCKPNIKHHQSPEMDCINPPKLEVYYVYDFVYHIQKPQVCQ